MLEQEKLEMMVLLEKVGGYDFCLMSDVSTACVKVTGVTMVPETFATMVLLETATASGYDFCLIDV